MDKTYYIYKITSPSNKVYIGRPDDMGERMATHKYLASRGENRPLYNAIRKYGWDNMKIEVIDQTFTLEDIITLEYKHIVENNSVKEGYNATLETRMGGDNITILRNTDKYANFVKKLSERSKGENNSMYGKKHSDEAKELQKLKAKGRFSKQWFVDRYGEEEGMNKYNERSENLKNRKDYKRDENGKFSSIS